MDRQQFLQQTAVAGALGIGPLGTAVLGAGLAWPGRPAAAQVRGANDRVRVALIGAGRRGVGMLQEALSLPNVGAVAVCDAEANAYLPKAYREPWRLEA